MPLETEPVFNVIYSEMKTPVGIVNVNQQLLKQVTVKTRLDTSPSFGKITFSDAPPCDFCSCICSGTMRQSMYIARKKIGI